MDIDKKDKKRMYSLRADLYNNSKMLDKSDWVISKRQKRKLTEKNEKIEIELNEFRVKYNDPEIDFKAYDNSVANSKWTKAGEKMESAGNKMQNSGRKITKVGAHVTGAVWTPVIYAGYQTFKSAKDKKKNDNTTLIGLVKECEDAYKEGKIDKNQMQHFINDYIENVYE